MKEIEKKKKRTPKQVAALICVILLAGVYLLTLIAACLDFPGADKLFATCLFATIGLPILLWVYIWLYGLIKERQKADLNQPALSADVDETGRMGEDFSSNQ